MKGNFISVSPTIDPPFKTSKLKKKNTMHGFQNYFHNIELMFYFLLPSSKVYWALSTVCWLPHGVDCVLWGGQRGLVALPLAGSPAAMWEVHRDVCVIREVLNGCRMLFDQKQPPVAIIGATEPRPAPGEEGQSSVQPQPGLSQPARHCCLWLN